MYNKTRFNKDKLPPAKLYFMNNLGLRLHGKGEWRMCRCPIHDDKVASLAVNVNKGCFKCHACGAKGGDIIAFEMQLNKLSFKDACVKLGIWEGV